MTTQICAGSANPAKVAAVREVFTPGEGFRVTYREAPSGVARSRVALPAPIADALREGVSLGTAVDRWMGREGVNRREGAIGVLTTGMVSRTELFAHVVRLLLGQARCGGVLPAHE